MAAYTRCLRCAGAPRRPASGSGLSLLIPSWHAVLSDPGESDIDMFQTFDADIAFAACPSARHSQQSRNPFHAGVSFRGFTGSLPLRPARLLAPLHGSDWDIPALGDFYFQAFDRSVSLPVAGYNFNSDWTPLLAGLSPAGMAASLAARSWTDESAPSISSPQHFQ